MISGIIVLLAAFPLTQSGQKSAVQLETLAAALGGGTEGTLDDNECTDLDRCPPEYIWNTTLQECVLPHELESPPG